MGQATDTSSELMHFPVQVRAIGDSVRRDTLLNILREQRVLDAEVLEQHPPFFWRGVISNSRLDAYFTLMLPSSLRNYASEAAAGVAFLPGHDHRHFPIGSSLTGEVSEAGEEMSVRADFYTLTGLQIGSIDTDDFITGIKAGLTRDMSIGFYGGRLICQICQQDYWRGRCPHIAGMTYEEEGDDGVIRQRLCTVGIDDAHLAEVSGVYDGATPGAMIEKVYEMARSGAIDADAVRYVQGIYRLDKATTERMLALPALQKQHVGVDVKDVSQNGQSPGKAERMNEEQFKQLTSTLIRAGVLTEEQRESASEADVLAAADNLAKRVTELEPRAADGDAYRNDLVGEALAEGVRAYGNEFDNETYEEQLRSAPLKVIKRMRDDWQGIGNARFPGGRSTTEGDESATVEPASYVPDVAYSG